MVDNGAEVLVTGKHERERLADLCQSFVSSRLGPAVGIHVRVQAIVPTAVKVRAATENGLR
ncbi:hypothetical protein ES703_122451 [subsurface metagenome]